MSSNNFQDWEPVTITRTKTKKEEVKSGNCDTVKRKEATNSNKPATVISKKDANDFEGIAHIPKPTLQLKQAIQNARQTLKLTQSDLDKACNFSPNTVSNYENGTATVVPGDLQKMEKVLKVKLPRPPKKKPVTNE
jgi:ribosome-binding protein aMBF1 (putative translation factor)